MVMVQVLVLCVLQVVQTQKFSETGILIFFLVFQVVVKQNREADQLGKPRGRKEINR